MRGDECNLMNVMFDTFRNGKREHAVCLWQKAKLFFVCVYAVNVISSLMILSTVLFGLFFR